MHGSQLVTYLYRNSQSCLLCSPVVIGDPAMMTGLNDHKHLLWTLTRWASLQGTSGLNVEQRMFDVLVERKHPRLMEVFDRLECSLGGLTGEWFSRMFTTALPAETTARVWDCVMVEGPKVLFRAALSLIKVQD